MKAQRIRHYTFDSIIGSNASFLHTIARAKMASKNSAPVLIQGETGTGKELIAQSIHYGGERQKEPFLAQNCAALPYGLVEGILFGTREGGFTGAIDRKGIFEQANYGTLLLDEINALPYDLQGRLLRVLQEDYVRPVGGTYDIPVDVRIIATLNEEPEYLIRKGRLRKDLFYRLNVIPIRVPPLRERKEDILPLAEAFIKKYNDKYHKAVKGISKDGLQDLMEYDYPGNIRELENLIMSAISMSEETDVLTSADLCISKTFPGC